MAIVIIISTFANFSVAFYNQQTTRWGPSKIIGLDQKLNLLEEEGFQSRVAYGFMVYKIDVVDGNGTELPGVWTLDLAQLSGVSLLLVGALILRDRYWKPGASKSHHSS
ncbi:MAG: hypothetical protein ACE5KG_00505 [Nitrososphaerales archaeon]